MDDTYIYTSIERMCHIYSVTKGMLPSLTLILEECIIITCAKRIFIV